MSPRALLLAALPALLGLVAAPAGARAAEGTGEGEAAATPPAAPPPAPAAEPAPRLLVVGLELRAVAAQQEDAGGRRANLPFGPGLFVRSGLWHFGLASEFRPPPSTPDWYAPGTSFLRRTGRTLSFTFGPSIPGTAFGAGDLARHLRLELLGEAGVFSSELAEELGADGIGDRSWRRTTPFVGGRVGTRLRFGGRWGGHFGVGAFYRQPLRDDRITTVTGARTSVVSSSFGLVLFGGPDVELR